MADKPNPGSPEAVDLGCTCPIIDNHYGKGAQGVPHLFWYTPGCPIHHPSLTAYPDEMQDQPLPHSEDDA